MANGWGDFCTYCGQSLGGDFPRKCKNGHYTYASPVMVGVALQPVNVDGKIGILTVQRNINPYKGEYALPGGFADNGETAQQAACRELSEETPINTRQAIYFSEATGGSHNSVDPRSHAMYFYATPVLKRHEINFDFKNEEVQSLKIVFLSKDKTHLENENGDALELCFSTHHHAVLEFLENY